MNCEFTNHIGVVKKGSHGSFVKHHLLMSHWKDFSGVQQLGFFLCLVWENSQNFEGTRETHRQLFLKVVVLERMT